VGQVTTARRTTPAPGELLARALKDAIAATLEAASVTPNGYLEIDLPSPTTTCALSLTYATGLSAGFPLQVQVGSGSTTGPVAIVNEAPTAPAIEMVGVVFAHWIGTAGPLSAPAPDPIAGATISTSLGSATTTTNASGYFDLQAGAPQPTTGCFTLTISAPGLPAFVAGRKSGNSTIVAYTLGSSPQYPVYGACS
jgi:hypothetical protein